MNLNDRRSVINNIYARLREIDSYKYGLMADEVIKIQTSILVFLKERIYPVDSSFDRIGENSYKSYLLEKIWSEVRKYWIGEVDNAPAINEIYNELTHHHLTTDECQRVLDAILDKKMRYEDPTPTQELSELLVELLDYRGGVVYNPNAGEGIIGSVLNIGNDYFGTTQDEILWYIGISKMLLHDKLPSKNYTCTHHEQNEIYSYENLVSISLSREFDIDLEEYFYRLTPHGKAIFVVPTGRLFNSRSRANIIVERNLLDKVILLPSSMLMGTGVNVAVLVCEKDRPEGKPVTMMDASGTEYYHISNSRHNILNSSRLLDDITNGHIDNKTEVSLELIAEENFNLNPQAYLRPVESLPEGYQAYPLKELTSPYKLQVMTPVRMREVENIVLLKPTHLEKNLTEFQINIDTIEPNREAYHKNCVELEKSCVLIAPRGRRLSAAYYKHTEGSKIYADNLLMILEVDESRIDPEYLIFKLRSIEGLSSSALSRTYILNYPISFPALPEQRRIVEDTIKANKLTKIKELGLSEEVQRLKNEYKTLIRTKKHNLGTVRENISASIRQLQKQVEQSNQTGEIDVKALFNRVNRLVGYWKDLDGRLDRIADENQFKETREFGFDQFFKNLESNRAVKNYTLSYNLDMATFDDIEAKFAINVNPDDFSQVVENIISNAEKHGFRDPNRGDYYLNIRVYCDENEDGGHRVCFVFENNGYPAPEMTKAQFGMSGWHADVKGSKGEGLGGAYISEMTRHFGGGYEAPQSVKDEIGEYSKTRVMIYFPAVIAFDETTFMKEYAFDTIYGIVNDHIEYEEYNINTGFDITWEEGLEVYIIPLQDYGYDLDDDDNIYIDPDGRPYHSDPPEDIHWINDITSLDENGKRVVNVEYVKKVVDKLLSKYRKRQGIKIILKE